MFIFLLQIDFSRWYGIIISNSQHSGSYVVLQDVCFTMARRLQYTMSNTTVNIAKEEVTPRKKDYRKTEEYLLKESV